MSRIHKVLLTPALAEFLNYPCCTDASHFSTGFVGTLYHYELHPVLGIDEDNHKHRRCEFPRKCVLVHSKAGDYAISHDWTDGRVAEQSKWIAPTAASKALLEAVERLLTEEEKREGYMVAGGFTLKDLALGSTEKAQTTTKNETAQSNEEAEAPENNVRNLRFWMSKESCPLYSPRSQYVKRIFPCTGDSKTVDNTENEDWEVIDSEDDDDSPDAWCLVVAD